MPDENLSSLEEMLHLGKCVLVMGPEAHLLDRFTEDKLPNHWDVLVEQVPELLRRKNFASDGFFFRNGSDAEWAIEKTRIHQAFSSYYVHLPIPKVYEYFASLPFRMYISLSPDDLLANAMDRFGYAYDYAYYKNTKGTSANRLYVQREVNGGKRIFKNNTELEGLPDEQRPLIFNFAGRHTDSGSTLYTYDSLFEFMYDVFPIKNIPGTVRNAIAEADAYVFVGFGYQYWYLKIFFFLLKNILIDTGKELQSNAVFNFSDERNPVIQVYQQVFKMNFLRKPSSELFGNLFSNATRGSFTRKPNFQKNPYRILLISSLPAGKMPIRPDRDFSTIKKTLEVPIALKSIVYDDALNSSVADVLPALNQYNPNLLILSVHGSKNGLFFESADSDEAFELKGSELLDKIKAHRNAPGSQLQMVILGACNSAGHAELLSETVDHTVGMAAPIHDHSVRLFLEGFLRNYALPERNSEEPSFHVVSSIAAGIDRLKSDRQYESDHGHISHFHQDRKQVRRLEDTNRASGPNIGAG
jgi:hypothetical protein